MFLLAEITQPGILGADLLELFNTNIDLKWKRITLDHFSMELMVQR